MLCAFNQAHETIFRYSFARLLHSKEGLDIQILRLYHHSIGLTLISTFRTIGWVQAQQIHFSLKVKQTCCT